METITIDFVSQLSNLDRVYLVKNPLDETLIIFNMQDYIVYYNPLNNELTTNDADGGKITFDNNTVIITDITDSIKTMFKTFIESYNKDK